MDAEELALLAAVCTDPADDTPRLVYADWLEEHGRGARAEFIRGSIRVPQCSHIELTKENPFPLLGVAEGEPVDISPGAGIPAALLTWMWGESADMGLVIYDMPRGLDYGVDRGFVRAVRCPAGTFLTRHAPALLWSPAATDECGRCYDQIRAAGLVNHCVCRGTGRVPRPCPPTAQPITRAVLTDLFSTRGSRVDTYHPMARLAEKHGIEWRAGDGPDRWVRVFSAEWPWVAFELRA